MSESDRETATVKIFGSESAGLNTPDQNFNDENDEGPLDFVVYNGIHPA